MSENKKKMKQEYTEQKSKNRKLGRHCPGYWSLHEIILMSCQLGHRLRLQAQRNRSVNE